MPIAVFRAFSIRDGELVGPEALPARARGQLGAAYAALTSLPACGNGGPAWDLPIEIKRKKAVSTILVPLQAFLTNEEYLATRTAPLSITRLRNSNGSDPAPVDWLWLYRDALYVTERPPRPSEVEEVILRIKALHARADEALRRLREEVANFDAIAEFAEADSARRPIPDDVKLVVWARDKGRCVRCGGATELHFDHIIPLAKGGGDQAENIQILCRICNLSKSDRLV